MSRIVRDSKLENRTSRSKLTASVKPYFRLIEPGLYLGYRRLTSGPGSWVVRQYIGDKKYTVKNLTTTDGRMVIADDFSDADGRGILTFAQAQDRAKAQGANAPDTTGPFTVDQAADLYINFLRTDGRTDDAIKETEMRIKAHIRPTLGKFKVAALTTDQLRGWRADLAKIQPRLRTKKGEEQKFRKSSNERARKSTANRILNTLKALLNYAFDEKKVASNHAWGRRVAKFKGADAARPGYLSMAEAKRLMGVCEPDFAKLVCGASMTGARYGGLTALQVKNFNGDVGTVDFRTRKGDGTERTFSCHLTVEGLQFFKLATAGRSGNDLIFKRANGEPWKKGDQTRPMIEACKLAKIKPRVGINQLRHTWASHAVMNGTPLLVVAQNLGHTDTRMVEKHYGHLAPSYKADAIRAGAPQFGLSKAAMVAIEGPNRVN